MTIFGRIGRHGRRPCISGDMRAHMNDERETASMPSNQFLLQITRSTIRLTQLPAYRIGMGWAVWCDHCLRYHRHGNAAGHRLAHCDRPGSPYTAAGYILVDAGPAPASVLDDLARRRPRGPEAVTDMPRGTPRAPVAA